MSLHIYIEQVSQRHLVGKYRRTAGHNDYKTIHSELIEGRNVAYKSTGISMEMYDQYLNQ